MNEPTHFTYQPFNREDDLQQGDILLPTEDIRRMLEDVHPHFLDSKYNAFLVLTQTCDLVRRNGAKPKTRYINLAVVRPLQDILCSLLDKVCTKVKISGNFAEGLYTLESRDNAEMLLKRILDQNEQSMGLFYLHPDANVKIAVESVALLQVSIAVRTEEHYEKLINAREGRLSVEFQSKLGWLVGNLFSRVATQDWPNKKRNELIDEFLGFNETSNMTPRWVSKESIKLANQANLNIIDLKVDEVIATLEKHKPPLKIDVAVEHVISTIKDLIDDIPDDTLDKIKGRLKSNIYFDALFK